jgi:hypothetical protein
MAGEAACARNAAVVITAVTRLALAHIPSGIAHGVSVEHSRCRIGIPLRMNLDFPARWGRQVILQFRAAWKESNDERYRYGLWVHVLFRCQAFFTVN